MQTSGTNPSLSDGMKKTVVTRPPVRRDPRPPGDKTDAPKPASTHRAGGHAKHARRGGK